MKPRKLTPSQIRSRIVLALKTLGYTVSEQCREQGRCKAWLRAPHAMRNPKAEAARVSKAITQAGLTSFGQHPAYGGEYEVYGPQYHVAINQDTDSGNGGGAFVEVSGRPKAANSRTVHTNQLF